MTALPDGQVSGRIGDIVARLHALHPRLIDLTLDRLLVLLGKLGNPQMHLPPIIHVGGTNGKGSTCAFLRAMGEAAGKRVHVYTSPHLVRFNERIRVASELVTDADLVAAMETVEQANAGAPITVFEVITAAAFYLFANTPAELCVLEVGLGGRGDATNVVPPPASCAIASISLDHVELLGPTLEAIAGEKAGIMKPGVPLVTGAQPDPVYAVLNAEAQRIGTPLLQRGRDWTIEATAGGMRFADPAGMVDLPHPSLPGPHQLDNAGIAVAAMRAAGLGVSNEAIARGIASAEWPARLQRLTGPLAARLPAEWELWLDGGHNPGAGEALAAHLAGWRDKPVHLVVGMKMAKDSAEFLRPLIPLASSLWAVAEPDQHNALPVEAIVAASGGVARPGPLVTDALRNIPRGEGPARVLICGSLYLAGEVLKFDAIGAE
ncbi:MAG TPA: folylpolyglutamate synthase/dihydrofolate synthase family protein [Acetobacteraceae bacterium]|nr:folylpolyglutamate synthase/dihydrofolate synthase family protein [Acetobacteraceae bacterium]